MTHGTLTVYAGCMCAQARTRLHIIATNTDHEINCNGKPHQFIAIKTQKKLLYNWACLLLKGAELQVDLRHCSLFLGRHAGKAALHLFIAHLG